MLQPRMIYAGAGHDANTDIAVASQLSEVEADLDDLRSRSDVEEFRSNRMEHAAGYNFNQAQRAATDPAAIGTPFAL